MDGEDKQLDKIIAILHRDKSALADRYGVTKLGVFGSIARGESTVSSDVDIVVQTKVPDLFMMVHLKEELEKLLGARVDLVRYWKRMNPYLKRRIDREARYV
jgi:predicted nucleotidyltransferase